MQFTNVLGTLQIFGQCTSLSLIGLSSPRSDEKKYRYSSKSVEKKYRYCNSSNKGGVFIKGR